MIQPFESGQEDWDETISKLEGAHILQSWEWGKFKSENGWDVTRFIWIDKKKKINAAAQILEKNIKVLHVGPNVKVIYIPKGPLLSAWNNNYLYREVISDLISYARKRGAIFIKIDPEVILEGEGLDDFSNVGQIRGRNIVSKLQKNGWLYSKEQIQFKNTVWLDLRKSEDELLIEMKQKTRYNLRLSQKKDVEIRLAQEKDLSILYALYAQTSLRDGFIIRPQEYYLSLWERLMQQEKAVGLLALADGEPVAGLILFIFAKKAWYFYGMSSESHREKMPNYLLQWEAIRAAKKLGCEIYDLWGAPNKMDENDPMWGVFRFKQGLGGKLVCTIGAWDYPVNKFVYNIYVNVLPRLLSVTRILRRRQIQAEILIQS
jgi:peptidoglycan pentaglycine glycine transferase (the first glycine)